jgi:dTDP-glucose 4,6-dehydratase
MLSRVKILVTGGAGFIGSNFLNVFVAEHPEHEFLNVDSLTYAANLDNLTSIQDAKNYAFSRVDLADAEATTDCVRTFGPDVVVHFAAESHVDRSIAGPAAFVRANVVGTFNLLDAVRGLSRPSVLFQHVSTDEVYGSLGDDGFFTETTPYDPSSPYSASKAASDHLVRAYHKTYGLRARVTNCSNNYGPYQFPEKLIPLMIANARDKKPLPVYGKGLNVRDWLYVEDHCRAIWTVLERGKDGETYNIGGNNEVKNIDLVHQLCDVVAAETGESPELLRGLIKYVADRPGHDHRYAIDASKIRRECGWEPQQTLETGLRETVRWYLRNEPWVAKVRSGAYREWMEQNYGKRDKSSSA